MIKTLHFFKKKKTLTPSHLSANVYHEHSRSSRLCPVCLLCLAVSLCSRFCCSRGWCLSPATVPGVIPAAGRDRAPRQSDSPAWFSHTLTPPSTSLPPIVGVTGNLGIGLGHEFPAALRSVTQNLFGPPAPGCLRGYGVSVLGVLYNAVDSLAQSPLHALVRAVGGLGAGELLVGDEMILFKAVSMPT